MVKCPICKEKGKKEDMIQVKHGKVNRYYHQNCHERYEREQEQRDKDVAERDSLVETVAKIYNIKVEEIPNTFYIATSNIRNGDPVFKGQAPKMYHKQGYSYYIIELTYQMCAKNLRHYRKTKNFTSLSQEFNYGLRVIMDKINYVSKRLDKVMADKELTEIRAKSNKPEEYVSGYSREKQSKNERDISDFL